MTLIGLAISIFSLLICVGKVSQNPPKFQGIGKISAKKKEK